MKHVRMQWLREMSPSAGENRLRTKIVSKKKTGLRALWSAQRARKSVSPALFIVSANHFRFPSSYTGIGRYRSTFVAKIPGGG